MNATQSSSSRPISWTTVIRRLRESGLHGQIDARIPLLSRGNKQKRFVWNKKHKEWIVDQWKSVLWSDESKCIYYGLDIWLQPLCERMDSACLVPTVKHGGGGVMVWGCFDGDTVGDLFKIKGILNKHGLHSILQRHAIPSSSHLVGPPGCVSTIWPRRRVMECCARWPGLHSHWTWTQSRWFGMRWTAEAKGPTIGNSFKTVGKSFQVTTSWSSSKEFQECAKQEPEQMVATLKKEEYMTYFQLFHTFF